MPYERTIGGLRYQIKNLEAAGKYRDAEKLHKQILERLGKDKTSADYRDALIQYASNLFGQGYHGSAIKSCRKAAKIVLTDIDVMVAQDVRILYMTACSHQELHQTLSARACWEQLLSLYDCGLAQGSRTLILETLASLALRTNDLDSAQHYLRRRLAQKATSTQPMSKHALEPLLEDLVKRLTCDEEYVSTRFWLRKLVQLHKKYWYDSRDYQGSLAYGKVLHRLANICRQLGQVRAARVLYKTHMRVGGPHLGSPFAELSDSLANFFMLDDQNKTR